MLELLIAAAVVAQSGGFAAPECEVAFERHEEARVVLRLRPGCPIGFSSTQGAVRAILGHAGDTQELPLAQAAPVRADAKLPYDAILWVVLMR